MAHLGPWEYDADNDLFTFNDHFYKIFHTTAEAVGVYTMSSFEYAQRFLHPDDMHLVGEEIKKAIETNDPNYNRQIEHRILSADGSIGYISVRFSIVKDACGKTVKIFGVNQDISESKLAEESLRSSEEKFYKVFHANPTLMAIRSLENGRYIDVNDSYLRITGYSREELIGENSRKLNIIDPGDAEKGREMIRKQGYARDLLTNFKTKTGDIRVGLFSAIFIEIDNKPCFLSATIDITERQRIYQALRESNELSNRLISAIPDPVVRTDINGDIQFVNDIALKISGYERSDFIGKNMLSIIVPEDHEKAIMNTRLMMEQQLGPVEYRFVTKEGAIRHFEVNGDVLREENGVPYNLVFVLRDITERKFAEREKKNLEAQLLQVQRLESIGNLSGGIAHDFNNILFPIVGMSEMLMEDFPAGSPEHESVRQIFKAAIRGSDLVKQILAFSRQSEQKMIPVRIQQVLKEVLKLCRSTIPTDIELTHDIQKDCDLVMADPTQLHQIAMNLITNAYHAVEPTGGKIQIILKAVKLSPKNISRLSIEPGRYAALSITDTGSGIEPVNIDRIFDPYFTTKEKGKGTGLGLALVYGIVKAHGGDIKVDSEIGKGAKFTVFLPLIKEPVETAPIEKTAALPSGHERILLVDDEEAIVSLEKQMLERLGYQISYRTSSTDALDAFKANPKAVDLVITDMTMPNMTGDQLAKELKNIKPGIPVIICTGFSERIDKGKAEAIGIKGFLFKPILLTDLAKTVRKVLDEANLENQG